MPVDSGSIFRPVAPPHVIDNAYTEDQHRRLMEVIRTRGPWNLIMANAFDTPEELLAAVSGNLPEGVEPTFDMFLTTHFNGHLAANGLSLFPEIEDCLFNPRLLEQARRYWNAEYAKPEFMHFIINGPCESNDPGHLDAAEFRGIARGTVPTWLTIMMPKSGLFRRWQMKKTQIVTWFYKGEIGGGFTYWPEGPANPPQRIPAPFWNRAVVSENEMMFHRGESNGPLDQRKPRGLALHSKLSADPETADGWQITTDGEVIQKFSAHETRLMVHWNAEVFMDYDELKLVMEHGDDLTTDQVFDMFIKDMRARGLTFEVPTDPLRDTRFIQLLNSVYDPGAPRSYPAEAPGPHRQAA